MNQEPLSKEDLADLTLLRLDYITACTIDEGANPEILYSAHVNPNPKETSSWIVEDGISIHKLPQVGFQEIIESLEAELSRFSSGLKESLKKNRAILVGVYEPRFMRRSPEESMDELKELCRTAGITVVDAIIQKKKIQFDTVVGSGKLNEISLAATEKEVELLVFDHELSSAQVRNLTRATLFKVIDRTQLILDIFAFNATSRDGKLQVELAQLKYMKGRLSELDDYMSRITGGIGGRGPGETKLEIGKRRVEEKITRLENELKKVKKNRILNRKKRERNQIPIVGIVGYTNAGKSSLLNVLTNSEILVENKLFATLDPTTRRIRFPEEREIIISDTVGFIHDLPPDLSNAFKATLEELGDADMLLNVIDASNPSYRVHMQAVEDILKSLDLQEVPILKVFNKADMLSEEEIESLAQEGVVVSAITKLNLDHLLDTIENLVWGIRSQEKEALASSSVW